MPTGSFNNAYSTYSLPNNTTGDGNAAFGGGSLVDNTTGSLNTGYGSWSLRNNTTGSYNTAIGAYTQCGSGNLSNSTAIGYEAAITSSNQVRIGSTNVHDIGGFANWTNVSDVRGKKNIRTNVPGLSFINLLKPVTYNLDLDAIDNLLKIDRKGDSSETLAPALSQEQLDIKRKARETKQQQIQTGFVAQDVEKTAKSIGYDFSGVNVDESGVYGLRYAEFVVPLVKAVQELSEQNDRLQAQIDELAEVVRQLSAKDNNASVLKSGNATTGTPELQESGAALQQNSPNPFTEQTEIRYTLPDSSYGVSLYLRYAG